jgi:hypothetical protein
MIEILKGIGKEEINIVGGRREGKTTFLLKMLTPNSLIIVANVAMISYLNSLAQNLFNENIISNLPQRIISYTQFLYNLNFYFHYDIFIDNYDLMDNFLDKCNLYMRNKVKCVTRTIK